MSIIKSDILWAVTNPLDLSDEETYILTWKFLREDKTLNGVRLIFYSEQKDWTDAHRANNLPFTRVKVADCHWHVFIDPHNLEIKYWYTHMDGDYVISDFPHEYTIEFRVYRGSPPKP